MNLKKWTTALTLCAVTFVASTTGVAPALAADDTAAVEPATPNLQAAAQALNAANQQLNNGGNTNSDSNNQQAQKPSDDTATLGYDYITLTEPAVTIDGQVYLPLRSTFAAMKSAALQVEWKPENQQKIKLLGTDAVFELYLVNGDSGLQLQKGGTTYAIQTANNTIYVPMTLFQAITQTANLELSGNDLLILKDKEGTSVWDSGKEFWYNMNHYQHATEQGQPQQPDVEQPDASQPQQPEEKPDVEIVVPDVEQPDANQPQEPQQPEEKPDVDVNVPDVQQPQQPDANKPSVPDINVPNNTIGGQIVNNALKYLGVPYVWGGTTPAGFDCSGLVQYVFAESGISLPRVTYEQQAVATPISLLELQPGDLVFWGDSAYHVGIYIGDNKYIHAPAPGQNVKIQSYAEYPYTSAGRILV